MFNSSYKSYSSDDGSLCRTKVLMTDEAITEKYRGGEGGMRKRRTRGVQMRRRTRSSREIASPHRWFVSDLLASWTAARVWKIDIQGVYIFRDVRTDACQRSSCDRTSTTTQKDRRSRTRCAIFILFAQAARNGYTREQHFMKMGIGAPLIYWKQAAFMRAFVKISTTRMKCSKIFKRRPTFNFSSAPRHFLNLHVIKY